MRQYQVDKTLQDLISEAEKQNKSSITVIARELNSLLPFTTEKDHNRCPMCCTAMRKIIKNGVDKIISETESGQSSTFTVEYRLPR